MSFNLFGCLRWVKLPIPLGDIINVAWLIVDLFLLWNPKPYVYEFWFMFVREMLKLWFRVVPNFKLGNWPLLYSEILGSLRLFEIGASFWFHSPYVPRLKSDVVFSGNIKGRSLVFVSDSILLGEVLVTDFILFA